MLLLGVKDGTRHNRTNLLFSLFHLLSIVLSQLFLQHLGEDLENAITVNLMNRYGWDEK